MKTLKLSKKELQVLYWAMNIFINSGGNYVKGSPASKSELEFADKLRNKLSAIPWGE